MTQTNGLSTIIREVSEHTKPILNDEELITIDVSTGQAVERPSIFGMFTGTFKYFLVSNTRAANKTIKGVKKVRYKEGQEEIFFAITYEGGCQPNHEWRLAETVFKSSNSEDIVSEALARWLIEYFSSGTRTIDDFQAERVAAGRALKDKAGQELGLELNVSLQLEGAEQLETIDLGPLLISSRLKDSDEEEGIWLKAELEVDQQRVLRALISRNKSLEELLKKAVRWYFGSCVTLDSFYNDLATERIKRGLSGHLNGVLKGVGRRVGFISLKPNEYRPRPFKGETVIEHLHHEYPDPIRIKISVLMIPVEPARYKAKGSPDLNKWLDDNLREVITLALFGISYVDFLLNFPQLKKQISDAMNVRAQEIGYTITQLMTFLELEPFKWLKRIDVEIKGTPLDDGQIAEAMFETSVSNFYVGLELFLTAKVKDLRGISPYLVTKQDVPQRIKEELIRLVRNFLHGTDPERFYMRYSSVDKEAYPNEVSFEEELRQKIQSLLKTEFNAEVIDLVLKPMQTQLTEKLAEISKAAHDFEANAELGNSPGAPAVIVKGNFKVRGVNGWQAFRECDANVAAIKKRIEDSIRARLKGMRDDQVTFSEQTGLTGLIEEALHAARRLIGDEFGLAVNLTTIYWDWEDELKIIGREQGRQEIASVQERILRLKERLLDLHENDASLEEIRLVEESIQRLSATLNPVLASSVGIQQLPKPKVANSLPPSELNQSDT